MASCCAANSPVLSLRLSERLRRKTTTLPSTNLTKAGGGGGGEDAGLGAFAPQRTLWCEPVLFRFFMLEDGHHTVCISALIKHILLRFYCEAVYA